MQRWFVYDKGAFSTQKGLFIKHEALIVWLIYKYDGAYDLSPKLLIAGSVHCVTAFLWNLARRAVFISSLVLFDNFIIYAHLYLYIYIYRCAYKTKF